MTLKKLKLQGSLENKHELVDVCHNPIFEQIIKKLNIVANGVKITKFEVWGCNLRVNWSILKELKVKDLIKG